MRYKYLTLFLILGKFTFAQMGNPLYSGKLIFGNWRTNIRFDSLRAGDTLVLKNDNMAREYQLNFSDSGKVTWYHERMDAGNTSLEIFDEWQPIGTWKKENGKIFVQTTLPEPSIPNSKKEKDITFTIVSETYTLVKLYVSTVSASK